jgi:hypothetical protein
MRPHLAFSFFLLPFFLAAQTSICKKNGHYAICGKDGKQLSALYDTLVAVDCTDSLGDHYFYLGLTGGRIEHKVIGSETVQFIDETGMENFKETDVTGTLLRDGTFQLLDSLGKILRAGIDNIYVFADGDYKFRPTNIRAPLVPVSIYVYDPVPAKVGGKWGVTDLKGKTIVPFQFDSVYWSDLGETSCYQAWNGSKTGFFSKTGVPLVPVKYDWVSPLIDEYLGYQEYSETPRPPLYLVRTGEKMGLLNDKGKELIPPKYLSLVPWSRDIYVFNTGGKFRIVHDSVEYQTEAFDSAGNEQFITVRNQVTDSIIIGGKFGVVNSKGRELIPALYDQVNVERTESGTLLFSVCKGGEENTGFPRRGEDDSYAPYITWRKYQSAESRWDSKCNYIDQDGKPICPGYDDVYMLTNEVRVNDTLTKQVVYYHVEKNGKVGVLNSKLQTLVPLAYDDVSMWMTENDKFLFLVSSKGKYGILDMKGKSLQPLKYDTVFNSTHGITYNIGATKTKARVAVYQEYLDNYDTINTVLLKGGQYGMLNNSGKEITALYDTIMEISDSYYGSGLYFYEVRHQKRYGLMDSAGKLIVPVEYDSMSLYNANLRVLHARQGNKWGAISSDGSVKIPCLYDIGPISFYDESVYRVKRDGKYGLTDPMGKVIFPAEYDDIVTGYPYGTSKEILVLVKNKKLGVYDMREKRLISPPFYDFIFPSPISDSILAVNTGAQDVMPDRYDPVSKYKGGQWGLMGRNGKLLVPVEYADIPQLNDETGTLKALHADGSADYYTLDGKKVADGADAWDRSYLGRRSKLHLPPPANEQWLPTQGPEGADATAFYIDKKGGYWLGTGSSGGVYFSSNQGKSWKEKNKGIGPVHVKSMDNLRDTLFIVTVGTGYEDPTDEFAGAYYDSTAMGIFYYDPGRDSWVRIREQEHLFALTSALTDSADARAGWMANQFPMPYADRTVDNYFAGFEYPHADEWKNFRGFEQQVGDSLHDSTIIFNSGFPKDAFAIRSGNLYAAGKGVILLAKSGVYAYNGKNSITRLSNRNLVASDVTQLVPAGNDSYFARTGTSDLWFYNGKKWKKLLDAYADQQKSHPVSYGGYVTGWMNPSPGNKIMFGYCGNIYEMGQDGKRTLVLKQDTLGDGARFVPLNASRDPLHPEKIYGFAFVVTEPETWTYESYSGTGVFGLFIYDVNTKKLDWINKEMASPQYVQKVPLVITDRKGKLWICTYDSIAKVADGKLVKYRPDQGLDPNTIGFSENGDMAVYGFSGLWFYDAGRDSWFKLSIPADGEITTLGFDNAGNLYAGCNYKFEYYCGGKGKLSDPGFFWLEFTSAGPVWHKLKKGQNDHIISIAPHSKGLALGTCGSGMCILKTK